MNLESVPACSARNEIVSDECDVWLLMSLRMVLRWPSSTDMKAFEGIRNCSMVASSDGRNAERTSDVFALTGLPAPSTIRRNF